MKKIKKDPLYHNVKHYIRILEDYQWSTDELYKARMELEDIAIQFQPVKGIRTNKQILENYKTDIDRFILEKVFREEEVERKQKRAMLAIDEANYIYNFIEDTIEKDLIHDLYMNRKLSRNEVADKYTYDIHSLSKKVYRIIRKAIVNEKVAKKGT